jgi:hypothetical protein
MRFFLWQKVMRESIACRLRLLRSIFHLFILSLSLLLFWQDIWGSFACRWRLLRSNFSLLLLLLLLLLLWQDIRGSFACRWRLLRSIFYLFYFIILAGHTRIYCMPFAPAASPHYRGAGTNFLKVSFFVPHFGGTGGLWNDSCVCVCDIISMRQKRPIICQKRPTMCRTNEALE